MRIDIKEYVEEKLLRDSALMRMSPTEYIHFLVENVEIKPAPKTIIEQETVILKREKEKIKQITNFVKKW